MTDPPEKPLRRGWTTGACATAAARAAACALAGGGFPDPVTIRLPRGGEARFALAEASLEGGVATAAIRKDAGDDPDVTHGCLVRVTVSHGAAGAGVVFRAGPGVGTVTKPGLQLAPGEPAINPVPRAMIRAVLEEVAGRDPDLLVTVSIPGGEELAARTLNGRLGIVGGLSILGTTGVVIPYSCSSWIHSIHRGIDVARAAGVRHLAAATGSTSERTVRELYGLADEALIDMGDFAGGMLKYLRRHSVPRLTLAGGFAKLAKLGQGHLDLHSARSRLDQEALARRAVAGGAPGGLVATIEGANTAMEMLEAATRLAFPLAELVARDARGVAQDTAGSRVAVEAIVVDRQGRAVARAAGW